MATTIGPIGMVFKGAYDAAVEYQLLNVVTSGGNSYMYKALTPGSGKPLPVAPAEATDYWGLIASRGEAIEMRLSDGYVQFRREGSSEAWQNLFSAADITPTFAVGTVTTGLPGTNAAVEDAGDPGAIVLNLTIPRGDTGGVSSVCGIAPDAQGNVVLTPADIGAAPAANAFKQYGVRWAHTNSSPILTRLGDAAGFANPVAAVGTGAGSSPFDNCYPWSAIRECNVSASGVVTAYKGDATFKRDGTAGDVMVEIPKFWVKVEHDASNLDWWIADGPLPGYTLHGAFKCGDRELDKIYVARYETSGAQATQASKSGIAPLVRITRNKFRTGAAAKGTGWSQWRVHDWMAVFMLLRVEFAHLNCQEKVGAGNSDTSEAIATGGTDAMVYHTGTGGTALTDNTAAIQYRGIENVWSNVWTFIDGFNLNALEAPYKSYICDTQANFADDTDVGYIRLSYALATAEGYQKKVGVDASHPWCNLPTEIGGSESTYLCDHYNQAAGAWRVGFVGGRWEHGSSCGAYLAVHHASSNAGTSFGSRLLWLPQ